METFYKTIEGRKYKFEPQELDNGLEWIYHVSCNDFDFVMHLNKNQNWQIRSSVTFVVREMEEDFAKAIEDKNE